MSNILNSNSKVSVIKRYKEYYRTDSYLAGMIKINRTEYIEKVGQEINIQIPNLSEYDEVYINGKKLSKELLSHVRQG